VTIVLDNAKAHHTQEVKKIAKKLNFELMFMPPYSPEFNCIEALWSVIKRDFKKRVIERKQVSIPDELFRELLLESLDAITPTV
jgi:putative transposase